MKKLVTFLFLFFCLSRPGRADHITGGELSYTLTGATGGSYSYSCVLKLYMRCNSGRSFNNPTIISVFNRANGSRAFDVNVPLSTTETIQITNPDPCISNPPPVCYEVGYFYFSLNLPGSADGYIVAGQVNYRISGIANLSPGYSQIGATYTAEIPGNRSAINNPENNSAKFTGSDLVIVCANNPFTYSFGAHDADNDELRYSFCEAYRSTSGPGGGGAGGNATAPLSPPYESVPYGNGFNGNLPLGNKVQIDRNTGLITGIAPSAGVYVVTVCVEEIRDGKVIATQRKDLQIAIASCNTTSAMLYPEYQLCRDTKSITLTNLSQSNLINSYDWEFRDSKGSLLYATQLPAANYTFPDTGIYSIKLIINKNDRCTDSTTAIARVYPGFYPNFTYAGVCAGKPTQFNDITSTVYGNVNGWTWNLGDNTAVFASSKNAVFSFDTRGDKVVKLMVSNSNGCYDSVYKLINIVDKPPLLLSFKDTIICINDQLQLHAGGAGSYSWAPNTNMINGNTSSPTVAPKVTSTYIASLNDNGCLNTDSVKVRVTDHVDLVAMGDTIICQGDAFQLHIVSNGLKYSWTPASQVSDPTIANPIATSFNKTTYEITANIGSCVAKDQVLVTTVPYPFANAGADTLICFGTHAILNGETGSNNFRWTPAASLNNPLLINPVAKPTTTTAYTLNVYDAEGCPKAGTDTVLVTVLPKIDARTSNDSAVVIGQPIPLLASGGNRYEWSPAIGLTATNRADPTAQYDLPYEQIVYRVLVYDAAGCVDSTFLRIKVFSTIPTVFVPTAFTPNGDGKNDVLKPIAVGIAQIEQFSVYNRYGQLLFTTRTNGMGWDGKINGQLQSSTAYVWWVRAIDYLGKPFSAKGTSVLIR